MHLVLRWRGLAYGREAQACRAHCDRGQEGTSRRMAGTSAVFGLAPGVENGNLLPG
jgi:hypothetical protein